MTEPLNDVNLTAMKEFDRKVRENPALGHDKSIPNGFSDITSSFVYTPR